MTERKQAAYDRLKATGHYAAVGRLGGLKTKERMLASDPGYYERVGMLGAKKLMETRGRDYFSTLGKIAARVKARNKMEREKEPVN
jgi:hypothetical protein